MSNARRIQFPTGVDAVATGWVANTFVFLLIKDSWVPDESADVVIADISANEFTDGSYGRQTAGTKSKAIVLAAAPETPGYVQYKCAAPNFGVVSGGEVATSLVLARDTGSDATSPLVASYPALYTADGVTPAAFGISANGAVVLSTLCPSDL